MTTPSTLTPSRTWIFLDETQRDYLTPDGQSSKLTAVAGIAISHHQLDSIERALVDLHSEILANPRFWYDDDPERKESFRKGLHMTVANETIRQHIHEKILPLSFRIHIAYSRHSPTENAPERYALLYHSILRKIVRRYRGHALNLVFEQHASLDQHYETIAKSACLVAEDSRPLSRLRSGNEGPTADSPRIVVARASKAAPACALADIALYTFGSAALSGLIPDISPEPRAHLVRKWTDDLAPRIAYEYDFDRDQHQTSGEGRGSVGSY